MRIYLESSLFRIRRRLLQSLLQTRKSGCSRPARRPSGRGHSPLWLELGLLQWPLLSIVGSDLWEVLPLMELPFVCPLLLPTIPIGSHPAPGASENLVLISLQAFENEYHFLSVPDPQFASPGARSPQLAPRG